MVSPREVADAAVSALVDAEAGDAIVAISEDRALTIVGTQEQARPILDHECEILTVLVAEEVLAHARGQLTGDGV